MLFISIPKPCNEDWNKITPNEKGGFCQVCSKTVVDFTQMTDDEVKNYFLKNSTTKTCGHFKKSQLKEPDQVQLLNNLVNNKLPYWQKFLAIAVISFSTLLISCNNAVNGEPTGKVSVSNSAVQSIPASVNTLTGAPIAIDTNNISTKPVHKKACPTTKIIDPEPTVDGQVIMGDIAFIDSSTTKTPASTKLLLPDTLQKSHKD
jgi:hypothetical protein